MVLIGRTDTPHSKTAQGAVLCGGVAMLKSTPERSARDTAVRVFTHWHFDPLRAFTTTWSSRHRSHLHWTNRIRALHHNARFSALVRLGSRMDTRFHRVHSFLRYCSFSNSVTIR